MVLLFGKPRSEDLKKADVDENGSEKVVVS